MTHFRSGECIAAIEDDRLISYSITSSANRNRRPIIPA
jgi:hypothetical protein